MLAEARGDNLNNLRDKTDDLQGAAQQFRRGANQVRKKMWWKVSEHRARDVVCREGTNFCL